MNHEIPLEKLETQFGIHDTELVRGNTELVRENTELVRENTELVRGATWIGPTSWFLPQEHWSH